MGLLYSKLKIFHYPEKIVSLPQDNPKITAPIHIRIKPINACNHNCSWCAYRNPNLQLGQDMNLKDYIPRHKMMEILNDISEMGVRAVTFSGGGEPLIYPHIIESIKFLADHKINFATLTNGANLQGEIAELFALYGTWVRISMDGWDDESYKQLRNVKHGEFTKIVTNMTNFKKIRGMRCYLGVNYVIGLENYNHIFDFVNRIKDTGIDSIKFSPRIVSNDGQENQKYHNQILKEVKRQIAKAVDKFASNKLEISDSFSELDTSFYKNYDWCPYLQILVVIGADQNVYSCQDKAYNTHCGLLGTLKDKSFKDFWFNGKEKFFSIIPRRDCNHHCAVDCRNKLLIDYFNIDKEHLSFV